MVANIWFKKLNLDPGDWWGIIDLTKSVQVE